MYSRKMGNRLRHMAEELFLRHARLLNRAQYGRPDMFRIVDIEITTLCNRKCGYCPLSYSSESKKKNYMDIRVFDRAISGLERIGFKGELNFGGYGEPLLDTRIPEFLRMARRRLPNVLLTVHTNGDFFTDEHLKLFSEYDIRAYVTLHDDSQKSKDFIRRYSKSEHVFVRQNIENDTLSTRGGLVEVKNREIKKICIHAPLILKINSSGDVVICADDFNAENTFGNVMERTLLDIWDDGHFSEIRRKLAAGNPELSICRHCFSR